MITRLELTAVRSVARASLDTEGAGVVLIGRNGAGKTSVLEAVHLLGHGRSFRGRVADGLIGRGHASVEVFAEVLTTGGGARRLGLRHEGDRWEGRADGRPLEALSDLVTLLPVLAFDPVSSGLVTGPAEERRRFVDFLLFHVEPDFLGLWRRYNRALRQRNGLLKTGGRPAEFEAFEREMAAVALPLHRLRADAIANLGLQVSVGLHALSPSFPGVGLSLRPGWRRDEQDLADALFLHRERDRELGYTTQGPHRADLRIEVDGLSASQLSRGQAKVLCLALVLAQAGALVASGRPPPVLCLDDLFAELDAEHAQRALVGVAALQAQAWISSPMVPDHVGEVLREYTKFHVEHGVIRRDSAP